MLPDRLGQVAFGAISLEPVRNVFDICSKDAQLWWPVPLARCRVSQLPLSDCLGEKGQSCNTHVLWFDNCCVLVLNVTVFTARVLVFRNNKWYI